MRFGTLCLVLCLVACSGKSGGGGDDDDDGVVLGGSDAGETKCVDKDDDGHGYGCRDGVDCDDTDPKITDECERCMTANKGCPCEPGTVPMTGCKPDPKRVTMDGVEGVLVCKEGTRYCRDGAWSNCEFIQEYTTFVPDK